MQKLNFSIVINAAKEKVWDTMLEDKTYRIWAEPFSPGSHFVGSWDKGSKILFLTPVILGTGHLLFQQGISSINLSLISTQQHSNGGVVLRYNK